ncbi:MAG: class II aldolase/adducin family protein [Actinobacteria bacterium]|nr:class II aldolase/adducin family protein [Actinomycetota bacterium]
MAGRDVADFVDAGRTLFSLGLVKGSEGNLSTWDGERLLITRTGSELSALGERDVLTGTLDEPPEEASSDLALHVARYRRRGAGAVAHAHPPGSVQEGAAEGTPHGAYAFASSLAEAVAAIVRDVRERSS